MPAQQLNSEATLFSTDSCPRCGGKHEMVKAQAFKRPNPNWSRWYMCPTYKEPVLMRPMPEEGTSG